MSFRNTFITDFIYQAGAEDILAANKKVLEVFERYTTQVDRKTDSRGFGYYSGRIDTSGGSIGEMADYKIDHFQRELAEATRVPFRLVILLESNAVITCDIQPRISERTNWKPKRRRFLPNLKRY